MRSRRGTKVLLIGVAGLLASLGALAQDGGEEGRRDLTELERTKLLSAEELDVVRRGRNRLGSHELPPPIQTPTKP